MKNEVKIDHSDQLRQISLPTQIIQPLFKLYQEAGHDTPYEKPKEFVNDLEEFIHSSKIPSKEGLFYKKI